MSQQNGWGDPREAAFRQGYAQASREYETGFQQALAQVRAEFQQALNQAAGGLRKETQRAIEKNMAANDKRLADLATIAEALRGERTGEGPDPGSVYIENIPGRRVPFTYLVEIPIESNSVSPRTQSFTVSQHGPFVAERRWATFLSSFEFQVTDSETGEEATIAGRSNGRYRPVHSASDYCDSQHNAMGDTVNWIVVGGVGGGAGVIAPNGVPGFASSASSFRTMQFDGRIELEDSGSSFRRQNYAVPSSFWSTETNGPIHLPALDFFERGDALTFTVTPNHVSNPPVGNATGVNIFPNGGVDGFPFADGQYDAHEGIVTADAISHPAETTYTPIETDVITRLPDGYLILALEGYRIIQVTGPSL